MNRDVIANRLIELRGSKKRSEVAREVGISISALSMYEGGNRIPRDEVKVSLARLYGTTVEDLFFNSEPHVTCGHTEVSA